MISRTSIVNTYTNKHKYTHTNTQTHKHTRKHTQTHTHTYAHKHTNTQAHPSNHKRKHTCFSIWSIIKSKPKSNKLSEGFSIIILRAWKQLSCIMSPNVHWMEQFDTCRGRSFAFHYLNVQARETVFELIGRLLSFVCQVAINAVSKFIFWIFMHIEYQK